MKKTKLALAIATSAMISTPVLATNGDNLIGLGAQSRALGGTGTAAYFGSENALTNPALIAKGEGTEFAIGGTLFKPDVKAETDVATLDGQAVSQTSDADTNIIPEVSLSTRINDNLTFGLGIFGSAGMGVDYRDNGGFDEDAVAPTPGVAPGENGNGTALFNGYSNLQIMKFAPSLAYNTNQFGIGFAPVIQYGALDINYKTYNMFTDETSNIGNGMSSDIGYGFNLGGYFNITKQLTIAAAYQSAISMEYKDQISVAAAGFGLEFSDKLEQPAEVKIGAAYTTGNWMLTADAKQIKWGDAEGYKDFNWEDQNVFGIGAKYSGNGYWVGAGYNVGSDPIDEINDGTYEGQATDMFNNHFFPGVVESHITFGGGYSLTKNMTLEAAVAYAPEVTKTVNTGAVSQGYAVNSWMQAGSPDLGGGTTAQDIAGMANGESTHEVSHSQIGYTVSLRMNF